MISLAGRVLAALLLAMPLLVTAQTPVDELLRINCAGCHGDPANPAAPLSRMGAQRKTPEGWEMTLRRMQLLHKAVFTDPAGASADEVFARLVRHFADTQGLAPKESAAYRYILERRLNTIDVPADPEFAVMCARCHSAARVGLQRRAEEEWRHLVHFHLGQFPTAEYSAGGRDRDWLGTALNKMVPMLASTYPLESKEWSAWQKARKPNLSGRWRVAGRMPGRGDFDGVMNATTGKDGDLDLALEARFADGEAIAASGRAIVYTGYEWRGALKSGDTRWLQVLDAGADGSTLGGRMFMADHEERGIDLHGWKDKGSTRVVAVSPAQIRRGETREIRISGIALAGNADLGKGLSVKRVVSQDKDNIVLEVTASADAPEGAHAAHVGIASLDRALTVYERIDRIEVSPSYAVGRVGGKEGAEPEVQAIFDALAFANGPDGAPATADDVAIGVVPAQWSVTPWNEQAASDRDVEFAGSMDTDSGVFTPAAAGPNPARKYGTNNAGNLQVNATVREGEQELRGKGRLLVTVQRWNNPPIR